MFSLVEECDAMVCTTFEMQTMLPSSALVVLLEKCSIIIIMRRCEHKMNFSIYDAVKANVTSLSKSVSAAFMPCVYSGAGMMCV